jgi:hypothetical protein
MYFGQELISYFISRKQRFVRMRYQVNAVGRQADNAA